MMKSTLGLFISVAIFLPIPCLGEPLSADKFNNLRTECVGRYQISVPGEVEVMLSRPRAFSSFSDIAMGQYISNSSMKLLSSKPNPAPFSSYHYGGELGISPTVPSVDFDNLKKMIKTGLIEGKKRLLKEALEKDKDGYPSLAKGRRERAAGIRPMDYDTPIKFGWGLPYPLIYLYQNNSIFIYESLHGDDEEVKREIEKQFNSVLNDLRPRSLYEVPTQPGVCTPNGFIADDGTAPRDIGVTMRLIDHPEVEIFFRDTAGYLTGGTRNEPKDEIEFFWTIMYRQYTKLTEADFWGYRSIKMGGQKGKGMLVTIHRYDGSIDYGYIAVTEVPSQMLYVIRTAARAKGKPVGIDDIKNIAEKIMASVKPHAVK